jgi:hypothetical protein
MTKPGSRVEENDDSAGGPPDDLVDQVERVGGALAAPDEGDVRPLAGSDGADVGDVDLARDHVVSQTHHDRRHKRQAIPALVGDQDKDDGRDGRRQELRDDVPRAP